MSREDLIAMTRNLVAHGAADTMEYADEIVRIPASAYTDEALFAREKQQPLNWRKSIVDLMKLLGLDSESRPAQRDYAGAATHAFGPRERKEEHRLIARARREAAVEREA